MLFENVYYIKRGERESVLTGVSDDEQFEQMIVVLSRHVAGGLDSLTVQQVLSEGRLGWPIRQKPP